MKLDSFVGKHRRDIRSRGNAIEAIGAAIIPRACGRLHACSIFPRDNFAVVCVLDFAWWRVTSRRGNFCGVTGNAPVNKGHSKSN